MQAPHIHYAVLNGRDHRVLQQVGVDGSRLHLVPNPVAPFGSLPDRDRARQALDDRFHVAPDRHYVLYPVRGIRRKNVGEALLWSALAGPHASIGITLPPINPAEGSSYARWKELASELELPCLFDVGAPGGLTYLDNLAAADTILTTSVAEGFGMVFLECWLAGRPLVGRDLPEITQDFRAAGIHFPGLFPQLTVPVEWVGQEEFRTAIESAYVRACADFGTRPGSVQQLRSTIDALVQDGLVDFARLRWTDQARIIRSLRQDPQRASQFHDCNPWIRESLSPDRPGAATTIEKNAAVVRTEYSLESTGHRLLELYHSILTSDRDDPITPPGDGTRVLETFLDPARLHPIRLES